MANSTSIGLGGGEAIIVELPLKKVRPMLQAALLDNVLLEFEDPRNGEEIIINPHQVKVLQHG